MFRCLTSVALSFVSLELCLPESDVFERQQVASECSFLDSWSLRSERKTLLSERSETNAVEVSSNPDLFWITKTQKRLTMGVETHGLACCMLLGQRLSMRISVQKVCRQWVKWCVRAGIACVQGKM